MNVKNLNFLLLLLLLMGKSVANDKCERDLLRKYNDLNKNSASVVLKEVHGLESDHPLVSKLDGFQHQEVIEPKSDDYEDLIQGTQKFLSNHKDSNLAGVKIELVTHPLASYSKNILLHFPVTDRNTAIAEKFLRKRLEDYKKSFVPWDVESQEKLD